MQKNANFGLCEKVDQFGPLELYKTNHNTYFIYRYCAKDRTRAIKKFTYIVNALTNQINKEER